MDVNNSPSAINLMRPEGNALDRPSVDGQMFDAFLDIATTLGFSAENFDTDHRDQDARSEKPDDTRFDLKERDEDRVTPESRSAERRIDPNKNRSETRRSELAELMSSDRNIEAPVEKDSEETVVVKNDDSEVKAKARDRADTKKSDDVETDKGVHVDQAEKTTDQEGQVSDDDKVEIDETLAAFGVVQQAQVSVDKSEKAPKASKASEGDTARMAEKYGTKLEKTIPLDTARLDTQKANQVEDPLLEQGKNEVGKGGLAADMSKDKLFVQTANPAVTEQVKKQDPMAEIPKHLQPAELANESSRFLEQADVAKISRQLRQLDGQAQIDGEQTQVDSKIASSEWNRLLQQDPSMEKMMRPKVDIEGKVTKLSTTGSRLTSAESAGSNRLNVGAPIPTSPTAKTPIVESAKQAQSTMSRQLPDGVDELSILRQISDGLKLKGGRTQRAEIRLHPEELGTVEIKMQVKGDAVRVSVSTEHAAVGDLLTNSLEQLKKDILAQGMHIEHIEVNSQLAGEGGQEGHGQNETDDANENEGQDAHGETVTRFHDGRLHVRA